MALEQILDSPVHDGKTSTSNQLVDTFGRAHDYLRISLTDKCNLRCSYCMPEEKIISTPSAKLMKAEEIFQIASVFSNLGIQKIRLTGGEPLVRKDAGHIIRALGTLRVQLNISTNATLVDGFIDDFLLAGIKSVNVSLDTFQEQKFEKLTRRTNLGKILSNIDLLLQYPFDIKINVVLMRGVNDDEIHDFVAYTRDHKVDVRFIEFMPFPGNGWDKDKVFSCHQILETIETRYAFDKLEDDVHSTSRNYRVSGHLGTFGVISTVTQPFCGDCNRLRLTADGKMKNCLFSKGEIDLLSAFRRGEDILPFILESVRGKKKELGGQTMYAPTENRTMISIGG